MTKTYEQRLSDLAEEMAKAEIHPSVLAVWDSLTDVQKSHDINKYRKAAAIALKHMAEEYIEGCNTIILDKYEIERNLINRGLDPQKP